MLGDSVRRRQPGRAGRGSPARRAGAGERPWLRWLPIAAAAVVLPFVVGYLFALFVLFPPQDAGLAGIAVPSLYGLHASEAEQTLRAAAFGGMDASELPHPAAPAGTVIAQSPLPGQQLRADAIVRVAVSAGRPRGIVPDVIGFETDRAVALLARLGFLTERRVEESPQPAGRVTRVDPQPGSQRELPFMVTLTVSGAPPEPAPLEALPDTLPMTSVRDGAGIEPRGHER